MPEHLAPVPERGAQPEAKLSKAAARSVRYDRHSAYPEDPAAQNTFMSALYNQYASLAYFLPWEVLDYVELLSTYNPDFSQAVENIRTLANSGHTLFIDAKDPKIAEEVKRRLEEKARIIEGRNGGIDGLVDQLLDQSATYGAMCGEWVLNEALDDVVDFAEVNPKHVRMFYDPDLSQWMPYQKVTVFQASKAEKNGQRVKNNIYVELNPNTFFYYAFDSAPGSPYGTPPFLAALGNIAIQRDMITNMAQIVKKVGLLGIIDFVVDKLPPQPGETDDAYSSRANAYLDSYVEAIECMVRDGGIVHFDDSKAETYQITGNAAGATAIFKQNEELIFSGLKSMPSVQGRSYSTTETYAGVAYDIIIRNTAKYQMACKRMIEAGYWLMITAWGYGDAVSAIRLEFNSNKSLHRLQDAQAELMEIRNSLLLWAAGIINQIDMAQRHGFDSPKEEFTEPPNSQLLGNGSAGGGAGPTSIATNDGNSADTKWLEGEGQLKMPDELRIKLMDLAKASGGSKTRATARRKAGQQLAQEVLDMQGEAQSKGEQLLDDLLAEVLDEVL